MKNIIAISLSLIMAVCLLCSCSCDNSNNNTDLTVSIVSTTSNNGNTAQSTLSDDEEIVDETDSNGVVHHVRRTKTKTSPVDNSTIRFSTHGSNSDDTDSSYSAADVLSPVQYKIYDEILRGIKSRKAVMEFDGVSQFDLIYAYNAVNKFNPSLFWFPKAYDVIRYTNGFNIKPHYEYTEEQIAGMTRRIESAVNSLLTDIPKSASNYDTALSIYEKMCEHISYDKNYSPEAYTIYGALISGRATCEGYARTYQYLLDLRGIRSVLVSGSVKNDGHMWNKVLLDGEWYNADVTLGDSDDILNHAYFNRTDAEFQSDHTADRVIKSDDKVTLPYELDFNVPLPPCSSVKLGYFQKNGRFIANNNEFEKVIGNTILKDGGKSSIIEFGTAAGVEPLPAKSDSGYDKFVQKVVKAVQAVSDKKISLYGVSGSHGFTIEFIGGNDE